MGKNKFASKPNSFKSKKYNANSTNNDIVGNVADFHTHTGGMGHSADSIKVTGFSTENGVLLGRDIGDASGILGGSHDASGRTDQAIVAFKSLANGKTMAITEHNTMGSIALLLKQLNEKIDIYNEENGANFPKYDTSRVIHRINGVNVIPGVEITCVVPGIKSDKGKDLKVHMLVYGARFEANGMLHRLLKAKHHNDLLRDQGLFKIIEKQFGVIISEQVIREYIIKKQSEVPGFGKFGPGNVVDFLKDKGISLPMNYDEIKKMLKSAPEPQRLQLSIEDVIKVAHASGGICILAHPHVNLNRIELGLPENAKKDQKIKKLASEKKKVVKKLLSFNIDGFEMVCNSANEVGNNLIRSTVKECGLDKSILYTAGSDTHFNVGDNLSSTTKLGRTKQGIINGDYQSKFYRELVNMDKARQNAKLNGNDQIMYRVNVPIYSAKEIENIVSKYEGAARTYQETFAQGVTNFTDIVGVELQDEEYAQTLRDKNIANYASYSDYIDDQNSKQIDVSGSPVYTYNSNMPVRHQNSDEKTK